MLFDYWWQAMSTRWGPLALEQDHTGSRVATICLNCAPLLKLHFKVIGFSKLGEKRISLGHLGHTYLPKIPRIKKSNVATNLRGGPSRLASLTDLNQQASSIHSPWRRTTSRLQGGGVVLFVTFCDLVD